MLFEEHGGRALKTDVGGELAEPVAKIDDKVFDRAERDAPTDDQIVIDAGFALLAEPGRGVAFRPVPFIDALYRGRLVHGKIGIDTQVGAALLLAAIGIDDDVVGRQFKLKFGIAVTIFAALVVEPHATQDLLYHFGGKAVVDRGFNPRPGRVERGQAVLNGLFAYGQGIGQGLLSRGEFLFERSLPLGVRMFQFLLPLGRCLADALLDAGLDLGLALVGGIKDQPTGSDQKQDRQDFGAFAHGFRVA